MFSTIVFPYHGCILVNKEIKERQAVLFSSFYPIGNILQYPPIYWGKTKSC